MRILTMLLLVASSAFLSAALNGCEETCEGDVQLNRCIIINKSGQDITFKSDHFEAVKICANDTLLCDDFNACPIYESLYGGNPILYIGEDSTIELSSENDARWPLNRLCSQIGKQEWMFSYIIDSKWIADAWAETQRNE